MSESVIKNPASYAEQVEGVQDVVMHFCNGMTEAVHLTPDAVVAGMTQAAAIAAANVMHNSETTDIESSIKALTLVFVLTAVGHYNDLVDATNAKEEEEDPLEALKDSLVGASFCQSCGHAHA